MSDDVDTPSPAEPERRPLPVRVLVAAGIVAAIGLLFPLARAHRAWGLPMDLAHLGLGAGLTWLVARFAERFGVSRLRAAWTGWVASTLFLGAFEIAQQLTARSPGLEDAVANALGGLATVLVLVLPRRRALPLAALVLAVGAAPVALAGLDLYRQGRDLPMLSDLETRLEMLRWGSSEGHVARVPSTDGRSGYEVEGVLPPGRWPGISLIHPYPDWRGWRALAFRVHMDQADALQVLVVDREHDETYGDRFNGSYDLPAGWSEVEIPIDAIARGPKTRPLDLERVDGITWFLLGPTQERRIRLDDVRLVK